MKSIYGLYSIILYTDFIKFSIKMQKLSWKNFRIIKNHNDILKMINELYYLYNKIIYHVSMLLIRELNNIIIILRCYLVLVRKFWHIIWFQKNNLLWYKGIPFGGFVSFFCFVTKSCLSPFPYDF